MERCLKKLVLEAEPTGFGDSKRVAGSRWDPLGEKNRARRARLEANTYILQPAEGQKINSPINVTLSPMNSQNGCGGRLADNRSTSRHNHQIVTGLFWCAVLCLVATSADAQLLSVGVKGGIPLNDAFLFTSLGTSPPGAVVTRESYFAKTKRYVVGPTVQVHLPLRLALEFNVLYRRLNYDRSSYYRTPSSGERFVITHNVANKWEFPLLMKYRLSGASVRPFVAVGVSVNRINGTRRVRDTGSRTFTEWYYTRTASPSGFALGIINNT